MDSEAKIQSDCIKWANTCSYLEMRLIFAIANGGKRTARTAAILKKTGVKKGVFDLFLPIARGGAHGLFIEMKTKTGRLTKLQVLMSKALDAQGYHTQIARSLVEFIDLCEWYLNLKTIQKGD